MCLVPSRVPPCIFDHVFLVVLTRIEYVDNVSHRKTSAMLSKTGHGRTTIAGRVSPEDADMFARLSVGGPGLSEVAFLHHGRYVIAICNLEV